MGMSESCWEDEQSPLLRLNASLLIEKFRFTSFRHAVEVQHADQFSVRRVATVFEVPGVVSLAWSCLLKLAVEMLVAPVLQNREAMEVTLQGQFA